MNGYVYTDNLFDHLDGTNQLLTCSSAFAEVLPKEMQKPPRGEKLPGHVLGLFQKFSHLIFTIIIMHFDRPHTRHEKTEAQGG